MSSSRTRDYQAEYQRRIASAAKRGLSRAQARGHARSGEALIRSKPVKSDDRLEAALKALRRSGNQGRAAREAGVSPERFRRFLRESDLAERKGRDWRITDRRPRDMTVISDGEVKIVRFGEPDQKSLNGQHLAAVKAFLSSNDIELLFPFAGRAVTDAKGKAHALETDPNALYRLAAAGSEIFHDVYRLVQ